MNEAVYDMTINEFEETYIRLRTAEGRVYNDEDLARLPSIRKDHPHYTEWQMRAVSCRKLLQYMEKKQIEKAAGEYLQILEIGCGNGWLSHRLATVPGTKVIGSDINFSELEQAGRVFNQFSNLHFLLGDIEAGLFRDQQFDQVVFAASIQYFPYLTTMLDTVFPLLKPGGEIHFLDSPFYKSTAVAAARQRSIEYFRSIGFPEMADAYFHHSWEELDSMKYTLLYDPAALMNRLERQKNIFPWIRINQ